jgi:glycosyltransferase involved in cell wall biosynthesis
VRLVAPLFLKLSDGFIVHNEFDRQALVDAYGIDAKPVRTIPHGPYDQYVSVPATADDAPVTTVSGDDPFRLLYFGVIRPFKGVEDIVEALDRMTEDEAQRFQLTVVGETWEDWTLPAERIAASPHADRITFINRYVADDEVAELFAVADAVVLPYHRSSSSGPLHIAMSQGLPVIVSAVGGLIEATEGYAGAIRIPPRDPRALREAMLHSTAQRGRRFADQHSWSRTIDGYGRLFEDLGVRQSVGR